MMSRTSKLLRLVGTATVGLALVASAAIAQPGGGGGRRGGGGMGQMMGAQMDAPLEAADLERIAKLVGLSKDQQEAANALLSGYMPEFQTKADEQRKLMDELREQFRETRDPSIWQDAAPKFQAFAKYRDGWEQKVLADVSGLLSPEQSGSWPRVERMRRREGTMQQSFVAGERVDLVRLVEGLELSKEQMSDVQPTIEAYELELDRDLAERNKAREEAMGQAAELMRNGEMDRLQEMFSANREKSVKVRDVNRKFARQLQNLVPVEKQGKFDGEFKKQSFPMVYREYYPVRALDAAVAMPELEATQRDAIGAVRETYRRDEAALNGRHEKAWEENEASMSVGRMFMGGMGQSDALREIREARQSLETETLNKVKAILSPEQFAKLPERRSMEDNNQGGGGGRGGQRMRQGGGDNPAGATPGDENRRGRTPATPATPAPAQPK